MLHFSDNVVAVEIDQIDREPHAESVHRLAGHNPQAFALAQGLPAEQTPVTGGSVIGYFHAMRNHGLRAQVVNLEDAGRVMPWSSAIRFCMSVRHRSQPSAARR